jgi:hypothetical protein
MITLAIMELLLTYFLQILLFFSLVGYGIGLVKSTKLKLEMVDGFVHPLIYSLLGFAFISFFASIANFFVPIKISCSLVVLLIGLLLFVKNVKILEKAITSEFLKIFLVILAIIFVVGLLYGFKEYDTGSYHIKATKFVVDEIVPLGIANFYPNLGYTTLSFSGLAIAEFYLFATNRPFILFYPMLFSLFIATSMLAFKNLKTSSNCFLFMCLIPLFVRSRSFTSLSPDNGVMIYNLIVFYLLIVLFEKKKQQFAKAL